MGKPISVIGRGDTSPGRSAAAVTPHDTNELTTYSRGIFVGTAGNITGVFEGDTDAVLLSNVPVGFYPWAFKIIKSTGTTAADIVAVF